MKQKARSLCFLVLVLFLWQGSSEATDYYYETMNFKAVGNVDYYVDGDSIIYRTDYKAMRVKSIVRDTGELVDIKKYEFQPDVSNWYGRSYFLAPLPGSWKQVNLDKSLYKAYLWIENFKG